jgi:predicted glutamine amidotransferase
MCGIIGCFVKNEKSIKNEIKELYSNQKMRGSQGYGIGIYKPPNTFIRLRSTTEKGIFDSSVWDKIRKEDYVMFHHRLPTSTPNIVKCNHPIMSEQKDIMLIHNGHINNVILDYEHEFETECSYNDTYVWDAKHYRYIFVDNDDVMIDVTDSEYAVHQLEEMSYNKNIDKVKELGNMHIASAFIVFFKGDSKMYFVSNNQDLQYVQAGCYELQTVKRIKKHYFKAEYKDVEFKNNYIVSSFDDVTDTLINSYGYIKHGKIKIKELDINTSNKIIDWCNCHYNCVECPYYKDCVSDFGGDMYGSKT